MTRQLSACLVPTVSHPDLRLSLFVEALIQPLYQVPEPDIECLTYAEQGHHGNRASRLDHLPVAYAETIGDHVLLRELTLRPIRSNALAQVTEEPLVMRWQFSAGSHAFSLSLHDQKHHEQKYVFYGTILGDGRCRARSWGAVSLGKFRA